MSDFVVDFDLVGGLSLDEWWKVMDRRTDGERRKIKRKGDTLKLIRETLKSWKSQETKLGPSNRHYDQFAVFRLGVPRERSGC